MSGTVRIGVDVGGTKVAFALVDEQGTILARHRIPTPVEQSTNAILDDIVQGILHTAAQSDQPVTQIGIGCPGSVDTHSGIVRNSVNLNWVEVNLRDEISRRLESDYVVQVTNDVNAQLLAEVHFGIARGKRNVAYLSIGTGLGGAAMVDGKLLYGTYFASMEMGHIPIDPNGRACTCGLAGCAEMYISGVGLMNGFEANKLQFPDSKLASLESPTTVDIVEHMQDGDPLAECIRQEAVDWLVRSLVLCDRILNPEMMIIGGGLGAALYPLIIDDVRTTYKSKMLMNSCPSEVIVEAAIDDTAIGATCLWL